MYFILLERKRRAVQFVIQKTKVMKNKPKESETTEIGGINYSWSYGCGKWSFKPSDIQISEAGFSVVEKTSYASDGSKLSKPMSRNYINDIRSRTTDGGKYKSAGSYGADIRR